MLDPITPDQQTAHAAVTEASERIAALTRIPTNPAAKMVTAYRERARAWDSLAETYAGTELHQNLWAALRLAAVHDRDAAAEWTRLAQLSKASR